MAYRGNELLLREIIFEKWLPKPLFMHDYKKKKLNIFERGVENCKTRIFK